MDDSLLRNRIVSYMGQALEMPFTPEMVPVDFFVNGAYMDSYTLGEDVRIGKNRVDIDEIDPAVTGGDEITRAGGILDQYAEELRLSWEHNRDRWLLDRLGGEATIDGQVEQLRAFLEGRRVAVNENLDELLTKVHCTLRFMDGEELLYERSVRSGDPLYVSLTLEVPEKDGYLFLGWTDPDGAYIDSGSVFVRDTELRASYLSEEDATRPDYLFFRPCDLWVDLNNGSEALVFFLSPEDAQDRRIFWEVADPGIAAIETDELTLSPVIAVKTVGDTVITGRTKAGLQSAFALHVFDSRLAPLEAPTALAPEQDTLRLHAGELGQLLFSPAPRNSRLSLSITSSDESVAAVDGYFGVVTGLRPGSCTITARDFGTGLEAKYTVTVSVEEASQTIGYNAE